jgi:hypothetical protein
MKALLLCSTEDNVIQVLAVLDCRPTHTDVVDLGHKLFERHRQKKMVPDAHNTASPDCKVSCALAGKQTRQKLHTSRRP